MPWDASFPYSRVTPEGVLYAGLRENFNALKGLVDVATAMPSWITPTLLNSWTSSPTFQYILHPFGFVYFRGKLNGTGKSSTYFLYLPTGYRPIQDVVYFRTAYYNSYPYIGLIDIENDGGMSSTGDYVYMDGCSFRVY